MLSISSHLINQQVKHFDAAFANYLCIWAGSRKKEPCRRLSCKIPVRTSMSFTCTASILYKSIVDSYRPVRVADGPIRVHYRFIKNAYWVIANNKGSGGICTASILYKSIAGGTGPSATLTARYRFIKNAYWVAAKNKGSGETLNMRRVAFVISTIF